MTKRVLFLCALMCALVALPLFAASYVVAPDDVFVRKSDAVVIARAVSSHVIETPESGIATVYEFTVAETLKGDPQTTLTLSIPGGAINGHAKIVGGAPTFEVGAEYLLFLASRAGGSHSLTDFALGAFSFSDQGSHHVVQRGGEIFGWDLDGNPHRERLRDAAAFLDYIREVGRGGTPEPHYFISIPSAATATATSLADRAHTDAAAFSGSTYTSFITSGAGCPSGGCGARWTTFPGAVSWQTGNTEPGAPGSPAGTTAVTTAFGAWNGGGANINYTLSASTNTGNLKGITDAGDGINNVVFEKDETQFAPNFSCGAGGLLGIGGIQNATSALNAKNGENYWTTTEVDVSMNKGIANCTSLFTSGDFNSAVTHEVGHTLGFRHSDQDRNNTPGNTCTPATMECTNTAIMNHQVPNGLTAHLQTYDQNAVATVYGSGPVCNNPAISIQPAGSTISTGQSANLSVTATGTSPTYQWYTGTSGNISSPVAGGTGSSIQVSPTSTTSYWVRVSGCGTSVDSSAATITVQCNSAAINTQPVGGTISTGSNTQLSVGATGSSLTYQWFIGNSGDTSNPINGGTSSSVFVAPQQTTNYWVRVSAACGSPANSNTVTVTVVCSPASINTQPVGGSITAGSNIQLNVGATGSSLTYQWFVGNSGDTSTPVPGGTGSTVFVTPAQTTNYWVRVSAACGSPANSSTVTVNVGVCQPPQITGASAVPGNVAPGGSAQLSASVSGSVSGTQWYIGTPPDKSNPLPQSGVTVTVTPSATTNYWLQATSGCGAAATNSSVVVVTVGNTCLPPTISTQPLSQLVTVGLSTTLSVTATGTTPLHYQWYKGASGNKSTRVGTDSSSFATDVVNSTTQYWVEVTNSCTNGVAQSSTATLTPYVSRHRGTKH